MDDIPRSTRRKDWRWIAAVAALLFALAMATVAVTAVITNSRVDDQTEVTERLSVLAEANAGAIAKIERNQEGIDELVAFIHERETDGSESETVRIIFELLCASSDPARIAACEELVP